MFRCRCFKYSLLKNIQLIWLISDCHTTAGDKMTIVAMTGDTEADDGAKEKDDVSKEREPLLWSGDVLRLTQVNDVVL